jgi:hypothetical protein
VATDGGFGEQKLAETAFFGVRELGDFNALDNSDHRSDSVANRGLACVALQHRLGLLPRWRLGLILIIVIILALMGRI